MARVWTCQGCGTKNDRIKQRCPVCARKRPASRKAADVALEAASYEQMVELYGEVCGICKRPPGAKRLHRDHDHRAGQEGRVRGLLCFRCNAALRNYMTEEWLEAAFAYVTFGATRRCGGGRREGDDDLGVGPRGL